MMLVRLVILLGFLSGCTAINDYNTQGRGAWYKTEAGQNYLLLKAITQRNDSCWIRTSHHGR
jgi:uncharacterized protein YceK